MNDLPHIFEDQRMLRDKLDTWIAFQIDLLQQKSHVRPPNSNEMTVLNDTVTQRAKVDQRIDKYEKILQRNHKNQNLKFRADTIHDMARMMKIEAQEQLPELERVAAAQPKLKRTDAPEYVVDHVGTVDNKRVASGSNKSMASRILERAERVFAPESLAGRAYDTTLSKYFSTDRQHAGQDFRRRALSGGVRVAALRAFIAGCDLTAMAMGQKVLPTAMYAGKLTGILGTAVVFNSKLMLSPRLFSFIISNRYGTKLPFVAVVKFVFCAFLCGLIQALLQHYPHAFKRGFKDFFGKEAIAPLGLAVALGGIVCVTINRFFPGKIIRPDNRIILFLFGYFIEVVRFTDYYLTQILEHGSPALAPDHELLEWFAAQGQHAVLRSFVPHIRDIIFYEIESRAGLPVGVGIFIDEALRFLRVFERLEGNVTSLKGMFPDHAVMLQAAHKLWKKMHDMDHQAFQI